MNRQQRIESYGNGYQTLVDGLKEFPRDMWQYRASSDPWTIHEIVVHIADSEVNSYVRCRRFLAEPGGNVLGYDENEWASALHYHQQSAEDSLELFKWLRLKTYQLIKGAPDSVWSRTVHHSESGIMTMAEWLETYERHVPDHLAQMQAIYLDWLEKK